MPSVKRNRNSVIPLDFPATILPPIRSIAGYQAKGATRPFPHVRNLNYFVYMIAFYNYTIYLIAVNFPYFISLKRLDYSERGLSRQESEIDKCTAGSSPAGPP